MASIRLYIQVPEVFALQNKCIEILDKCIIYIFYISLEFCFKVNLCFVQQIQSSSIYVYSDRLPLLAPS